jgi:NAD+ kinase
VIRLGVVGNRRYDGLADILRELLRRAPELELKLSFEDSLYEIAQGGDRLDGLADVDALLTLGGDGTLLRGARLLAGREVPIVGINLGHLGFLTTCGRDELAEALARLADGDYVVDPRMTLEAHSTRDEGPGRWLAMNDVVLHKGGFARVVQLRVSVNGELVGAYAADGVIVSTPTGSTAYSLSAGGPVVVPTVESIVLTPISPHTLAIRPVVLPPAAEVSVHAEGGPDELLVTIDGQVGSTFAPGDTLVVRRAEVRVLIMRFSDTTFFSRMRRKLDWGGLRERDDIGPC